MLQTCAMGAALNVFRVNETVAEVGRFRSSSFISFAPTNPPVLPSATAAARYTEPGRTNTAPLIPVPETRLPTIPSPAPAIRRSRPRVETDSGEIRRGPNITGSLHILEADLSAFRLDNLSSGVSCCCSPRLVLSSNIRPPTLKFLDSYFKKNQIRDRIPVFFFKFVVPCHVRNDVPSGISFLTGSHAYSHLSHPGEAVCSVVNATACSGRYRCWKWSDFPPTDVLPSPKCERVHHAPLISPPSSSLHPRIPTTHPYNLNPLKINECPGLVDAAASSSVLGGTEGGKSRGGAGTDSKKNPNTSCICYPGSMRGQSRRQTRG